MYISLPFSSTSIALQSCAKQNYGLLQYYLIFKCLAKQHQWELGSIAEIFI